MESLFLQQKFYQKHKKFLSKWLKDSKKDFGHIASMAKVYASEVAMRASTECVQIHGGYGVTQWLPLDPSYSGRKST